MLPLAKTNKKAFLDFLENKFYGGSGLEVAYAHNDKFSKWHLWQDVRDDAYFVEKVNQRSIFHQSELVIDIDPKKGDDKILLLKSVLTKLNKWNLKPVIFDTGNKGFHCIVIDDSLAKYSPEKRKKVHMNILSYLNADTMKASIRTLIGLEYAPHRLTGKIKKVIAYEYS